MNSVCALSGISSTAVQVCGAKPVWIVCHHGMHAYRLVLTSWRSLHPNFFSGQSFPKQIDELVDQPSLPGDKRPVARFLQLRRSFRHTQWLRISFNRLRLLKIEALRTFDILALSRCSDRSRLSIWLLTN